MSIQRTIPITGLLLGALAGCSRQPAVEPTSDLTEEVAQVLPYQPTDPAVVTAAPSMATTVLANEWVGVARVNLAPGALIPPHDAGLQYVYPYSACTLSVVAHGNEELVRLLPGELVSWPAGRLSLANAGDSPGDLLMIERRPLSTVPDLSGLPVADIAIDMQAHGTVLLDDDAVLAADISLGQLQGIPLPPNMPMLMVALSDCDLTVQRSEEDDFELSIEAGQAEWESAGLEGVSNVGDGAAHFLVVGLRK
jgi:hypothetical protein